MGAKSVEMMELRIPISAVGKLTAGERYTYYLLGHMFNELMTLQKLVGYTLPKHEDQRPARLRPELAQSFFLFRLSSSKVWEVKERLHSNEVAPVLRKSMLIHLTDGETRLKALNKLISSVKWLSTVRNDLGFHFPKLQHWQEFTTPTDSWIDDSIFLSERSGNVFYDASESVAMHWLLGQGGQGDPRVVIEGLVNDMIELLSETNRFLEDVLSAFIWHVLLPKGVRPSSAGRVRAPQHETMSIPFWTWMPARKPVR